MTRLPMCSILAAAVLWAVPAAAHDEYRIIGTVIKVTAKTLEVKQSKDGKIVPMRADDSMLVTRDKKKVATEELKAGASVVVDALGDDMTDLVVVEVRIVAAPTRK
jgi:hypothetical protein